MAACEHSAIRAVDTDPELAEAHASLGFIRLHYDRDWEGAERELRKAILLRPSNQVAHRWYAYSLSAMGRLRPVVLSILLILSTCYQLDLVIASDSFNHAVWRPGRFRAR